MKNRPKQAATSHVDPKTARRLHELAPALGIDDVDAFIASVNRAAGQMRAAYHGTGGVLAALAGSDAQVAEAVANHRYVMECAAQGVSPYRARRADRRYAASAAGIQAARDQADRERRAAEPPTLHLSDDHFHGDGDGGSGANDGGRAIEPLAA